MENTSTNNGDQSSPKPKKLPIIKRLGIAFLAAWITASVIEHDRWGAVSKPSDILVVAAGGLPLAVGAPTGILILSYAKDYEAKYRLDNKNEATGSKIGMAIGTLLTLSFWGPFWGLGKINLQ